MKEFLQLLESSDSDLTPSGFIFVDFDSVQGLIIKAMIGEECGMAVYIEAETKGRVYKGFLKHYVISDGLVVHGIETLKKQIENKKGRR